MTPDPLKQLAEEKARKMVEVWRAGFYLLRVAIAEALLEWREAGRLEERETVEIKIESFDYWATCGCGFSMRVPSGPTDKVKMPVFCCGCGKRIIYRGVHRGIASEIEAGPTGEKP